jgi:hypothetical protein
MVDTLCRNVVEGTSDEVVDVPSRVTARHVTSGIVPQTPLSNNKLRHSRQQPFTTVDNSVARAKSRARLVWYRYA